MQFQGEALGDDLRRPLQMLQASGGIAEEQEEVAVIRQAESRAERLLAQVTRLFVGIAGRVMNGAAGGGVPVVVDDQGAVVAAPVGVSEDILIHRAIGLVEIVEQEILAIGKQPALVEQGRNLPVVPLNQSPIRILLVASPAKFHAVLLRKPLDLPVAEHRQPGKSGHHGRDPKAFVAVTELVNGRTLIRIAHEINVALEDIRVELDGVLDHRPVLRIVLVAHHVHEGAVVHPVHAEGADKVTLHQPERFRQQQRAGNLPRNTIHYLAPELVRHGSIEIGLAHAVLGA